MFSHASTGERTKTTISMSTLKRKTRGTQKTPNAQKPTPSPLTNEDQLHPPPFHQERKSQTELQHKGPKLPVFKQPPGVLFPHEENME